MKSTDCFSVDYNLSAVSPNAHNKIHVRYSSLSLSSRSDNIGCAVHHQVARAHRHKTLHVLIINPKGFSRRCLDAKEKVGKAKYIHHTYPQKNSISSSDYASFLKETKSSLYSPFL